MLTKNEMLEVIGGGFNWTVVGIIAAGLTLIAGIIDGYLRPLKCN